MEHTCVWYMGLFPEGGTYCFVQTQTILVNFMFRDQEPVAFKTTYCLLGQPDRNLMSFIYYLHKKFLFIVIYLIT